MTTPANEVPVAIDYTSRDFYSLRDDLTARIQANVNVPGTGVNWTGTDPSDFGVALVEAFSYMGDIVNYYIDRIANENFIGTATQRQSIIDLARTYGYVPAGYKAATTQLLFHNTSSAVVTVPAGTQVSGNAIFNDVVEEVIFTTLNDVIVPAQVDDTPGTSESSLSVHGELASTLPQNDPNYGENLGPSDGTPEQVFVLSENQVVDDSIQVYVEVGNGTDYNLWRRVTHLADSGPTDAVYTVETDANNFVYINFGDGVSGAIPSNGSLVKVDYYIGGGQLGNVTSGLIDTIRRTTPGVDLSNISVVNTTAGINGADPESNDSIRTNAPKALSALNRAVTLKDYANLALVVPNVGKANAVAESRNSVTIYISPQQGSGSTDLYPGYTGDPFSGGVLTSSWSDLVASVDSYLADKLMIGVSTSVIQPTYVPVHLTVKFSKQTQYTNDQVKASITLALVTAFSYNAMSFQDILTPEEIEYQIRQVEGVYNATVISLYKTGGSGRNTLLGGPGEIFVFDENNIFVNPLGSDSSLSALTASAGTLAPSFSSTQLNYNLPLPNGTTSVDILPTATLGTTTVNGVQVVGTTPITVTTPVGVTSIAIVVTAEDGITTQSYRITASRSS